MNNTTLATAVLSTIESNVTNEKDADGYLVKVGPVIVYDFKQK